MLVPLVTVPILIFSIILVTIIVLFGHELDGYACGSCTGHLALHQQMAIGSDVRCLASVALALFVLMHKGRGGGLSDLFGGGISSSLGGSSVAERNLDRLTVIIGVVWLAAIVALNLLYKLGG